MHHPEEPRQTRRRIVTRLAGMAGLAAAGVPVTAALAQPAWAPSRPVRIAVTFPTGGLLDYIIRAITPQLTAALGEPVIVENRPGANGNLAGSVVAKAPPDGLTLLAASSDTIAVNPFLYQADFDPLKDLVPITQLVSAPLMIVARPDFPATDAKSLIAHLKANPKTLSYGTPGIGSSLHLIGEIFQRETGIKLNHVPYKGLAAAIADLQGGHLDLVFDGGVSLPQIRDGKLKMLTVAGRERLPEFPAIGTLAEAGVQGFETDVTFVLMAPAGTPAAAIERLAAAAGQAVRAESLQGPLRARNLRPIGNAPADARRALQAESERQGRVIREAGIKVE